MNRLGLILTGVAIGSVGVAQAQQDPNVVNLRALDDRTEIRGSLVSYEDDTFVVDTTIGQLKIASDTVICEGRACPADYKVGQVVNLTSITGNFKMTGVLENADDGILTISSEDFDSIRLPQDSVRCDGPGCPSTAIILAGAAPDSVVPEDLEADQQNVTASDNPAVTAKLRLAGSDTVGLGLMPYLLKDYADRLDAAAQTDEISDIETKVSYKAGSGQEITSIYVNATGSGDAFDGLLNGAADLGMTSRQIKPEEEEALNEAGFGPIAGTSSETVIAVDSLAIITHPSNPVSALSMRQIGDIYQGRVDNWSQVGGPDLAITVLSREDGSSTRGVFERAVFDGQEPPLADRVTYPGGDNPEIAQAVRDDPSAIGYVGFSFSDGLNRLDVAGSCGIVSQATPFTVKTEEYPLKRRLYLYNRSDDIGEDAEKFLQYVLSPDADDAIAQSDFVNFAVERQPQSKSRFDNALRGLEDQAEFRLARALLSDLPDWDRLSTTIRFPIGSSALGLKEQNDVARLVSYLSDLPDGTRVAVVGFADSNGSFERNAVLSQRRANAAAAAIQDEAGDSLGNLEFETRAYSELSPALCNDSEEGRRVNRRSEIWVQK